MIRQRKIEANKRYRARSNGENIPLRCRPWTVEECNELVQLYQRYASQKNSWLKEFANRIGRSTCNIVRKAKTLGCQTNRKRVQPFHLLSQFMQHKRLRATIPEHVKRQESSARTKALWQSRPHPRGMFGKNHTQETRERMSSSHLGKSNGPFSEEHKMKISRNMVMRLQNNPASLARGPRGKYGRREDLGNQFFRSRYEANYARYLNFTNQLWEYEKKTFWFDKIKRGVRSYTPDFYLPQTNEFHEVKGWMDKKSQTKLKRMKKYFPEVKIVVIDGGFFSAANKQGMCRIIPHWECLHKAHQPQLVD